MIDLSKALDALHAISPDLPYDDWIRVGMAAQEAGLTFDVFDAWSAGASNYDHRASLKARRNFTPCQGIEPGTLFWMAKDQGWCCGYGHKLEQRHIGQPCLMGRLADAVQLQQLSNHGHALWRSGHLIEDPAAEYLRFRRCAQPPKDEHLRWLSAQKHHSRHISRPGKALEAIKAQLAARGHAVHDGGDRVHFRQRFRHCPDYFALLNFGRQLGVLV